MKKILAIGNSFSQDATALIEKLTDKLFVRNLYIGGCSLSQHAELLKSDRKEYEYQKDGEKCISEAVSLGEALSFEQWDYITIQQVSGLSGILESYYPYIKELIGYVRKRSEAEIVFHQTWPYEQGSKHKDFGKYEFSRDTMWKAIHQATEEVCKKEDLRMIPTGKVVAKLSNSQFFDVGKRAESLYRDGFHLSLGYGRYVAACVWIKFFTGNLPEIVDIDLKGEFKIINSVFKRNLKVVGNI